MAVVQCAAAASSFHPFPTNPLPPPRKPVIILSSISSPFPSKPTRRKNHLRKKIFKILPNPVISSTPPSKLIFSFEKLQEQPPEAKESEEGHELQVLTSETTHGIVSGEIGKFSTRPVSRWGLYLIGALVFQTIFAILVSRSVNSSQKDRTLEGGRRPRVSELGIDGNDDEKTGIWLNASGNSFTGKLGFKQGENGLVIDSELEKKISEIQAMAREVRERERLNSEVHGSGNDADVKTGIEMEVDSNLVNLRKRLQNSSEKSLMLPDSYFKKSDKVEDMYDEDGVDAKDEKTPLIFRKNNKFRIPLGDVRDKPKSLNVSEDHSITRNENTSSVDEDESIRNGSVDSGSVVLLGKDQKLDHPNGNLRGIVSFPLEEESGEKPAKEKSKSFQNPSKKLGNGVSNPERGDGATQGNGLGRHLVKGVSSTNSAMGSLRAGGEVDDRHSDDKADLWWLSLPYVLVILCHNAEGPKGLFMCNNNGDSSYTVAFEDKEDATDFCYLLQPFFKDLGDLSAEIVPLSIKELDEAVMLDNMEGNCGEERAT